MNVSRAGLWAGGIILCVACWRAGAAASPDISGQWTGKVTGTSYTEDNSNQQTGTVKKAERISASVNGTFTQTGNDLTVTLNVLTQQNETLLFNMTGKVGDFALWASGVHAPAGETPQQLFMAAQFDGKAKKVAGNFVVFHNGEATGLVISLKKSTVRSEEIAEPAIDRGASGGGGSDDLPFSIGGTVTGKTFTFSSNAKAAKLKTTLSGMIVPLLKSATITIASTQETFTVTEYDGGKGVVFYGASASNQMVLFGTAGNSSAAGTGFIYGDAQLSIFKWNAKKK